MNGERSVYVCDRCKKEMVRSEKKAIFVMEEIDRRNKTTGKLCDLCLECYAPIEKYIKREKIKRKGENK